MFLFQLVASDGVQQSSPVSVTITVLDANDNTPTFPNVSYSVNLFTDMMPGETVLQVRRRSRCSDVSPASAEPVKQNGVSIPLSAAVSP